MPISIAEPIALSSLETVSNRRQRGLTLHLVETVLDRFKIECSERRGGDDERIRRPRPAAHILALGRSEKPDLNSRRDSAVLYACKGPSCRRPNGIQFAIEGRGY